MNKLGFGFLRLPKDGESIDYPLLNQMVDTFLSHGGTYFDTAYIYMDGKSEQAIRESVVKRHPREAFCLADKLRVGCKSCERHCPRRLTIADYFIPVAKVFDK